MPKTAPVQQLKDAKHRKGEIARQFKQVTPGSPEHQQLLAAMQVITEEIKSLEAQSAPTKTSQATPNIVAVKKIPPTYTIDPQHLWRDAVRVRELSAEELPLWYQFLAAQAQTSVYHLPVWQSLIQQNFGHNNCVLAAFSNSGALLGGIPLTLFNSRLFGRFAVSVPYFNYGGVVSPYFDVAQQLITGAAQLCVTKNLAHIEVRTLVPDLTPQVSSKKVSMILALPPSQEALEKQLGAKVRAQYKKALEFSPVFKTGKLELLDDFYQVFAYNMRDLGTPVYSKSWFASILNTPELNTHLALVYMRGRAVSAGFLIGHHGLLEIPWASTLKSANAKNANMWMYRQILDFAIAQGYDFFDFGRSTEGAGTYKFKKQWGAEPHTHYWYYALPPQGEMPGLNPDNPKYKMLIALWQRLPVWLTKILGPAIVRDIP